MARETVAQRNARLEAERQERQEAERSAYPNRLMNLLERVSNEYQFELSVKNGFFNVQNRNDRYNSEYELSYSWSEHAQETLENLLWKVEEAERERAEAQRRVAVKKEAERKARELFTDEERELLGL
jgi:hypothetical protein